MGLRLGHYVVLKGGSKLRGSGVSRRFLGSLLLESCLGKVFEYCLPPLNALKVRISFIGGGGRSLTAPASLTARCAISHEKGGPSALKMLYGSLSTPLSQPSPTVLPLFP